MLESSFGRRKTVPKSATIFWKICYNLVKVEKAESRNEKLPESEQEIMMIVWEYAEPVSRFQIEEKLNVEKNIAPSTI